MDDGNLRESLGIAAFYREQEEREEATLQPLRAELEQAEGSRILGMTAPQRCGVALMVLLLTFTIGSLVLVLADKVVIPL